MITRDVDEPVPLADDAANNSFAVPEENLR
jgi:hypothetical protein